MLSQYSQERLVRGTRRSFSAIPARLRFVLGLLFCGGLIWYLFEEQPPTTTPKKNALNPYTPAAGGDWGAFDTIFALYVHSPCTRLQQLVSLADAFRRAIVETPGVPRASMLGEISRTNGIPLGTQICRKSVYVPARWLWI